jgi:hypothetical protein
VEATAPGDSAKVIWGRPFYMKSSSDKSTLALLRVIGGWILAVGSFIVAVAVTLEVLQDDSCKHDPDPSGRYVIEVKRADTD